MIRERRKEDGAVSDPSTPEPRSQLGLRLIVALSILVYLGLAWIIVVWLPGYFFLALVPAMFALHSTPVLLTRNRQ